LAARALLLAIALPLATGPGVAVAQSNLLYPLVAHARVVAQCGIQAQDLDFGDYSPFAGNQAQTWIEVRCTPGIRATLTLDGGGSGDTDNRRMIGPGRLAYQLYRDASHRRPFGDQRRDDEVIRADGLLQRVPVYGDAPSGQLAPPGAYRDTIVMTITY
jgi:spore coat protein U-like protein